MGFCGNENSLAMPSRRNLASECWRVSMLFVMERSFWIPLKMIVKSFLRKHLENLTKSKLKSPLHNFCTMNAHRREDYST